MSEQPKCDPSGDKTYFEQLAGELESLARSAEMEGGTEIYGDDALNLRESAKALRTLFAERNQLRAEVARVTGQAARLRADKEALQAKIGHLKKVCAQLMIDNSSLADAKRDMKAEVERLRAIAEEQGTLLLDCQKVHRRLYKDDLPDCIDNDGNQYQSAHLDQVLREAAEAALEAGKEKL